MHPEPRDDGPDAVTQPHRVTATRPMSTPPGTAASADARAEHGGTSGGRASGGQTSGGQTSGGRTSGGVVDQGRRVGAATASAATASARGARRAGRAVGRAGQGSLRAVRRVTHARGAGESGLARVLELHLVATAADTLILTALASTIFFAVPTEQARGRVATSLLVTMVPFVVLAPLIGPLLDRFRHGRRYALATTMVVRAFLAWVMAGAVGGADSSQAAFSLYPAAFGFLVSQKAYIVTRAAALPRVLPPDVGLVAANSRMSLAGVASMTLAAPLGIGLNAWLGPSVTLRLAFVVFAAGTVLALALPARVDSSAGEGTARIRSGDTRPIGAGAGTVRAGTGPRVVHGLRANTAIRAFTGFLTLFLAFRLRHEPLGGLADTTAVALVVALAAVGGGAGTALGGALRRSRPEVTVAAAVAGTTLAVAWAALAYGLWPVLAVSFIAGLGQSLAKLSLDALIQADVAEQVRTSAFARSETVLQLAWVIGGGVGLVLPLSGAWGLGFAAVAMAAATVLLATGLARLSADRGGPGRPTRPAHGR